MSATDPKRTLGSICGVASVSRRAHPQPALVLVELTGASEERGIRAVEKIPGTVILEPPLPRLETRDNRMARGRVVFGCMLIW